MVGARGGLHRIAVMGGDGVGPELVDAALRVLERTAALDGFAYETVEFPHGAAHYKKTGELFPESAYELLQTCDSLLFGAAGVYDLPPGLIERALIMDLAKRLDLSIGVRNAFLHHPDLTPIKGLQRGDVDLVFVRDCTEGELIIPGGPMQKGTPYETRASLLMHTRQGVDQTLRYAFELAQTRRKRVTLCAQSNVLVPHMLWEERLEALAPEYPDVEHDAMYPDHFAMQLVANPKHFDVIATTLLYGGIFSDLAGALVGGIGLIGSVRRNPVTGFGMYEPAHGSAPKYTGLDKVSPMATFNALAMLLRDLGEKQAATRVEWAIDDVLSHGRAGLSTRSPVGTKASTDLVIAALDHAPAP